MLHLYCIMICSMCNSLRLQKRLTYFSLEIPIAKKVWTYKVSTCCWRNGAKRRSRAVKSSICQIQFLPSAMKWDRIKRGVSVFSSIPHWIWTMLCFSLDSLRFLWDRRTCPPKCINTRQSLESLGPRVVTWPFAPKRPSCHSSWGRAEKVNSTFYYII